MSVPTATRPAQPGQRPAGRSRVLAPLRRAPLALWVCVLVGFLNAVAWAVATPSFQVPDEPVHVGYVQWLAETGKLPRPFDTLPGHFDLSEELRIAVFDSNFSWQGTPIWRPDVSRNLHKALSSGPSRKREQAAGAAANYPPLYYAAEAIPYKLASNADILDRLLAMRIFSALFAALTTAFTFLFVRELLPSTPWAWTVGALAVALQPVAAFMSGGVNPDTLLWAASAAALWSVLRILRHGLTVRRAAGLAAALVAALLTKGTSFALLPGAGLALAAAIWWAAPERRRRTLALAVGCVGVVAVVYFGWLYASEHVWHRVGTEVAGFTSGKHGTITEQLSYLWQFFLPKLPFMNEQFPGYPHYPLWDVYFQGFVGRFGYFSFGFPMWVNWLALAIAGGVLGLAASALVRARAAVRRRLPELAILVVTLVAVLVLVGIAGLRFRLNVGLNFEQTRYLFPLLPLYGAVMALAARGAGRRYGPVAGTALVLLCAAWNLFAVLLTAGHYYS